MICISIAQESRGFTLVDMFNAGPQCDLLEVRLLKLVTRLEGLLKDCVREKVANLQPNQGLAAPSGRRVDLRFQAVERSVVQLKQSPSPYINRIYQYGNKVLNALVSERKQAE